MTETSCRILSDLCNTLIAAPNLAHRAKRLAMLWIFFTGPWLAAVAAHAGPGGGKVVSGSGQIGTSGTTTTITQYSQDLSLTWQNFNIASQETVDFLQPSASSLAVNRILGTNGTQILGQLHSNGQVYLINPNGILFGPGAQVSVGSLVASTLDTPDFGAASSSSTGLTRLFSGSGTGSVTNEGSITASPEGYVALLGNRVSNTGTINARLGSVALAGGSAATLTFSGDSLVGVEVDRSTLGALAANGGLIQANGGSVTLTAGARNAVLASAVNNTGLIEAQTVDDRSGTITLLGGMSAGQVSVGGTLDASAPDGGNGGTIETSGAHVSVADDAHITTLAASGTTGSWRVDPQDFTVAASGGDITGATLSTELGATNVELDSSNGGTAGSGNVNINDTVSWSANTTLRLTASNNVNVNANVTLSGNTAGLSINPDSLNGVEPPTGTGAFNLGPGASITITGSSPTLVIAGTPYTVITGLGAQGSQTGADLQGMTGNLAGNYALGTGIDAAATAGWNSGAGFTPIGPFTGAFNGLGHTITGLVINLPGTSYVGLFSQVASAATVENVGLVGASVTGGSSGAGEGTGALVGANAGTVIGAYSTGTVTSPTSYPNFSTDTGGLVGANLNGATISNSYSTAAVSGYDQVGGLVGSNTGTISTSYSAGAASGSGSTGGLAGLNAGSILESYSTASANSSSFGATGGLVGREDGGEISDSYATGSVSGTNTLGFGGLVGDLVGGASIGNSYAAGALSGNGGPVGGLVGASDGSGTVTGSFWDTTATGQSSSAAGMPAATAAMQQQSTFAGWDLANTWIVYSGETYPLLRPFMTPLTVTASDVSRTYDGTAYSGGNGVTYSTTPGANLLGTLSYGGSAQGAVDAGGYAVTPQGLYSNQQGYTIDYVSGTLTIEPKTLTVTGTTAANKTYDGTTAATLSGGALVGVIGSDSVNLSQGGSFASPNVGTGIPVTASDSINGAAAGNYTLVEPTGLAANITPATLTVAGTSVVPKTYDGTTTATLTGGVLAGVIGADAVSLAQAGTFASPNAGTGIPVTASDSINGAAAGNYTLIEPTGVTGTINPATLTVSGTTAASKVYDGTTAATLAGGVLQGVIGTDAVNLTQAGSFATANIGTGIPVTAADAISGASAGNYALVQPSGLFANITPATLTVAGTSVVPKTYDGTTAATLTGGVLAGVIGSDAVSLAQAGTFVSPNVGTGIPVAASDAISGGAAGNYALVQPAGLAGDILQLPSTTPEPVITTAQTSPSPQTTPPAIAWLESCVLPRAGKCTDFAAVVEADLKLRIESDGVRLPDTRLRLQ